MQVPLESCKFSWVVWIEIKNIFWNFKEEFKIFNKQDQLKQIHFHNKNDNICRFCHTSVFRRTTRQNVPIDCGFPCAWTENPLCSLTGCLLLLQSHRYVMETKSPFIILFIKSFRKAKHFDRQTTVCRKTKTVMLRSPICTSCSIFKLYVREWTSCTRGNTQEKQTCYAETY